MRQFHLTFIFTVLGLGLGLGLSGTALAQGEITDAPVQKHDVRSVQPADPWKQRYELGPGDVLLCRMHGSPELTRSDVVVAHDGTVSYLQARHISVTGLTIQEARGKLEKELGTYYRDPKLILTPSAIGSKRYTILGQMTGTFTLSRPITLLEAFASAGGIPAGSRVNEGSSGVDFESSLVVRNGKVLNVNLADLYLRGDLSQNIQVEAGDYIYIARQNENVCYVFGAVNRPGPITFHDNLTATGAIASAAGYGRAAWQKKVLVVSGSLTNPKSVMVDTKSAHLGKSVGTRLERGDIVYVHTRPWAIAEDLTQVAIRSFVRGIAVGVADEAAVSIGLDNNVISR